MGTTFFRISGFRTSNIFVVVASGLVSGLDSGFVSEPVADLTAGGAGASDLTSVDAASVTGAALTSGMLAGLGRLSCVLPVRLPLPEVDFILAIFVLLNVCLSLGMIELSSEPHTPSPFNIERTLKFLLRVDASINLPRLWKQYCCEEIDYARLAILEVPRWRYRLGVRTADSQSCLKLLQVLCHQHN
jgi:hypothetical protein